MWNNRFYLAFIGIGFNSLFGKPEKFIRIACTSFIKFIENDLHSPKIQCQEIYCRNRCYAAQILIGYPQGKAIGSSMRAKFTSSPKRLANGNNFFGSTCWNERCIGNTRYYSGNIVIYKSGFCPFVLFGYCDVSRKISVFGTGSFANNMQ